MSLLFNHIGLFCFGFFSFLEIGVIANVNTKKKKGKKEKEKLTVGQGATGRNGRSLRQNLESGILNWGYVNP